MDFNEVPYKFDAVAEEDADDELLNAEDEDDDDDDDDEEEDEDEDE